MDERTHILFFFFFFWPRCTACRILVPRPGIEPGPPAVEAPSPNHWTAREFPLLSEKNSGEQNISEAACCAELNKL